MRSKLTSDLCFLGDRPHYNMVIFTNGDHGQSTYSWVFRKLIGDAASLAWI